MKIPMVSDYLEQSLAVQKVAKSFAGHQVQRMVGFWFLWHVFGGHDGLIESAVLSRASVYRQEVEFLVMFKKEVSDMWPHISEPIATERREAAEKEESKK